jgi:hypothetical protein
MKEALSSSEMSVLTRATRRNIPEDAMSHTKLNPDPECLLGFTKLFSIGYHPQAHDLTKIAL